MSKRIHVELPQIVFALAFLLLMIQFGTALLDYGRHAAAALTFPYPLEYGEGPILDQVVRLAKSENIYRADVSAPPYTVSSYPPLYLLIQVPLVRVFGAAFWYGRAISILSAILAAVSVALTVQTLTDDWIAAVVAGLLLPTFPYLLHWSVFDRVDSLPLALTWTGLFAVVRWPDRRRGLVLPVLLLTAAIYTKPSYALVAPLTAFIWLWQAKRRQRAIWLVLSLGVIVVGLFLFLDLTTRGGFFFNVILSNLTTMSYQNLVTNWIDLLVGAFYLLLGCGAFIFLERLGDCTRSWPLVTSYLTLAAIASIAVARAESNVNDLMELAAALCLGTGAFLAWLNKNHWIKAAVTFVLVLQVSGMVNWSRDKYMPRVMEKTYAVTEFDQLAQLVRTASGPVLADEYMGLLPLTGHPLYFQPFEFWQLTQAGVWDDTTLVDAIQRRKFPLILWYEPHLGANNRPYVISRWSPSIRGAVWENYQVKTTLSDVWVYVPKES